MVIVMHNYITVWFSVLSQETVFSFTGKDLRLDEKTGVWTNTRVDFLSETNDVGFSRQSLTQSHTH